jgi:two-component system chemotaxis sensor kinase CheA
MKMNEVKNTGHYKVANASAVVMVVFLGTNAVIQAFRNEGTSENFMLVSTVFTLLLLIPVFRSTKNPTNLAFIIPFIIFLYNIFITILGEWSFYFLLVCLCTSGISCLYSNFRLTMLYSVIQAMAVGALFILGFPIAGPIVTLDIELVCMAIYLFSTAVMLILARSAIVTLNEATGDGNSFRVFLSTTANYLAMVDQTNKVIYVSKPLSDLAGIEDPELASGRSLIDLFPGRDLKLLAGEMLGQRTFYEKDWEFVLNGQKRYFKAASNSFSGASTGTLVNLHDMTFLAERDEIAAMKDSLKIGLFFIDRNFIIQDNYSRYLEELLSETELNGKQFIEFLTKSVTTKEQDAIKDYFDMVFERTFDQAILEDINPLQELHYVSPSTGDKKIFQCEFTPVERGKGEIFILVTIYDITVKVELERRLAEEEAKRQEEMRSIFELIQVDPNVFADFLGDAEYEFTRIDETLKNEKLSAHDALVEVYQSVHAIKSNAVILGLNTFGDKVHALESQIKKLREMETEVPFDEMLHLTVALEGLSHEKDGFKTVIDRINSFKVGGSNEGQKQNQNQYVLIETLTKTTSRAASDMGKQIKFVAADVDPVAIEKGPRRLIKEVLMQLIRNSVVHGIEMPEVRRAKGKNETGVIKLSIKTDGKVIQVKLMDDGGGLNFAKIRDKALSQNLIKKEDANNKNALLNAIFLPGFSTAETEGVHAGRGIGLNLVRDRVRDAKGTMKLQSEPGKGTLFCILFPVDNTAAQPPQAQQKAQPKAS